MKLPQELADMLRAKAQEERESYDRGVKTRERIEKEVLIPMLNECHDPNVTYTGCFQGIALYREVVDCFLGNADEMPPLVLAKTARHMAKALIIHAEHLEAELARTEEAE